MTSVKLRLNPQLRTMSDLVGCSKKTVHNIFRRLINLMCVKLKFLIKWSDHDASMQTLPNVFRQYFSTLTAIIDCNETFIDRPKTYKARDQVHSNQKKHSAVKFLIASTPFGSISFISKAWGGPVSNIDIVKGSGLLNPNGDQIFADRGFTVQDEFAAGCGMELIITSFTKGKKQLSAKEVKVSQQIASVRIHVERVIRLINNR